MEALVTSYLSKKLSPGMGASKAASFSNDSLESSNRVQGLLSGGINFTRSGPQNDPWLDVLAKMPCKLLSSPAGQQPSQQEQAGRALAWDRPTSPGTPTHGLLGKGQKRPLDTACGQQSPVGPALKQHQQFAARAGPVVLQNSGSRVQVGLTNVGNTCYFNAMLQCLTNCKPFYNYIRSEIHDRSICKRGDQCVLCLLKSFCVSQMPVNPNEKVVSGGVLRDLLVKMRTAVRRWKIHAHQSVDEILSYVLDSMWDRDMAYFGVTNRQHTPMMGLFGTLVEQQYACSVCGQASISTVVEPTLILGLVNGDRRSVQDRLRMEYGLTETLSEPKSKCDACGRSRTPKPTMKRVLKNLPMILVVMLKRFYVIDGISHKINQFVQFPESLDLRPCMDSSAINQNSLYRLSGVVEHWGKSVTDGHYVAYCKNYCQQKRTEAWFCLNDRQVRTIDAREVLQKQAYLLFYTVQGQATRTIDTVSSAKAALVNGDRLNTANSTDVVREAKMAKISAGGATKMSKLIPSKFVPIVVLKKPGAAEKNGTTPSSSTTSTSFSSSTSVSFSKAACQQKTSTALPFVNGNGPTALVKSPVVKINGESSQQKSADQTTNGGGTPSVLFVRNGVRDTGVSPAAKRTSPPPTTSNGTGAPQSSKSPRDAVNGGPNPTSSSVATLRKSLFGTPVSKNSDSKPASQSQKRTDQAMRSSLVPYATSSSGSSDEDSDNEIAKVSTGKSTSSLNGGSSLKRGIVSALQSPVPRAASSSGWVVDKLNDTPSLNSTSSSQYSNGSGSNTNTSVHSTSPAWCVTPEANGSSPATSNGVRNGSKATSPVNGNDATSNGHQSPRQQQAEEQDRKPESTTNSSSRQSTPARSSVSPPTSTIANGGKTSPAANVPMISYQPRMPPSLQNASPNKGATSGGSKGGDVKKMREEKSPPRSAGAAAATTPVSNDNGSRNGDSFSYWGAPLNESKDERELYDEELDQGRQKKQKLQWKASRWNASKSSQDSQQNPFQREQEIRFRESNGMPGILHTTQFKRQHHHHHHHQHSQQHRPGSSSFAGNGGQGHKLYRWHRAGYRNVNPGQHNQSRSVWKSPSFR